MVTPADALFASPAAALKDLPYHFATNMPQTPPSTPLGHKRRRTQASTTALVLIEATDLISMDDGPGSTSSSTNLLDPQPALSSPERLLQTVGQRTEPAYQRHLKNYLAWWANDQAARTTQDPTWKEVPSLPITATKVAWFLEYETTREKRKRKSAPDDSDTHAGTTVGRAGIQQAISALEHHRLNHQHEYPNDREAQTKLRDDTRIQAFESAAKHNEPKRAESAQAQKAAGTSVGQ
ncbi:hypothetical protein DFH08DRAFT_1044630 [Mycena albidolilacea]|uniref:Uncharacterized protein n=1 Tax=Mycena albidolilacea TaxID=1033008 RepID=A0AAD6Z9K0_9AGAR|nr:hypothetical protein DFH08DRAFT_1044630 [Mycena albidolilacea]